MMDAEMVNVLEVINSLIPIISKNKTQQCADIMMTCMLRWHWMLQDHVTRICTRAVATF
jgi:hypothetical protein